MVTKVIKKKFLKKRSYREKKKQEGVSSADWILRAYAYFGGRGGIGLGAAYKNKEARDSTRGSLDRAAHQDLNPDAYYRYEYDMIHGGINEAVPPSSLSINDGSVREKKPPSNQPEPPSRPNNNHQGPSSTNPSASDPRRNDPNVGILSPPLAILPPRAGNNTGGSNTSGNNTGGSNPGGNNTGGSNPGGSNPGGNNTGGSNPGGNNTGGNNSGASALPGGLGGIIATLSSIYGWGKAIKTWYDLGRRAFASIFDPIALDLNGNGIETLAADGHDGAMFDHERSGIHTGTGWVHSNDGILVYDRNGDGKINNGGELFGDNTLLKDGFTAAHGFAALAELGEEWRWQSGCCRQRLQ